MSKILSLLAVVLLFVGCQCPKIVKVSNIDYVALDLVAKKEKIAFKCNDDSYTIQNLNHSFTLKANSRAFMHNGVKMWLATEPIYFQKTLHISNYDYQNTILPLLGKVALVGEKPKKIVLDPGHGAKYSGAVGAISMEKDLNLIIAKKVGKLLTGNGIEVVYTREADDLLELAPRAAWAKESGADLFLSIHCNAAPTAKAEGIETFSISPRGFSNSNDNNDHSLNVNAEDRATGYANTVESFLLSSAIQSKLIRATNAVDRGAKRARFHVLYHNTVPAALVECGFMSNIEEEKLLNSSEYTDLVAKSIVDGILEFINYYHMENKK